MARIAYVRSAQAAQPYPHQAAASRAVPPEALIFRNDETVPAIEQPEGLFTAEVSRWR